MGFAKSLLLGLSLLIGCGGTARVARIAVLAPASGPEGKAMRKAVELAVSQNSYRLHRMGFQVEVVVFADDSSTGESAKAIAADPRILAVVGPPSTESSLISFEYFHGAQLCCVTPSIPDPEATDRGYLEINRLCGRNDVQGALGARIAQGKGASRAVVLHDGTPAGRSLADAICREADVHGPLVVDYQDLRSHSEITELAEAFLRKRPDMVYLASGSASHIRQLRAAGFKGLVIASDRVDLDSREALKECLGTLVTTVAGPAGAYPGAQRFIRDYRKAYGSDPGPFAAQAYDSAALVLYGIEGAITQAGGNLPDRPAVARAVRSARSVQGLTTQLSLDGRGDPLKAGYAVLRVTSTDSKEWPALRVEFSREIRL